jgi:hypothetical protein
MSASGPIGPSAPVGAIEITPDGAVRIEAGEPATPTERTGDPPDAALARSRW